MLKRTHLIAVTILAVALTVVVPIFSINSAEGKGTDVLVGNFRQSGSITCPDGSTIDHAGVSINASESTQSGKYIIYSPGKETPGDISKVQLNANNFNLAGTGSPVCPSDSSDPTTISIRGACSGISNTIVMYKAQSGERGTLGIQAAC